VVRLGGDKSDWGFKALKQIVKLQLKLRNYGSVLSSYREMLRYIKSADPRNLHKVIVKIFELVSTSGEIALLQELFDTTHDALKHTNIDRLWFKTNPALKIQLLVNVVAELELDDELSFALSCCSLRHAVVAARDGGRARSTTRICSVLGSPQKLAWAISCGLPMDIACRRAANGVLDALV
ncbi:hypothetical protein T492DRAFT_857299, partial [Pavlovales sp. CCMP2436]